MTTSPSPGTVSYTHLDVYKRQVLEYCASLGDIHDIVVENMERQAGGMHG